VYIPFENSAHWLINEEPGKLLVELVNRVRPMAIADPIEPGQGDPEQPVS